MPTLAQRLRAVDHESPEDCFMQSPLFDKAAYHIEQLEARLAHIDGIYPGAIDNLMHHQRQLDADGIDVGVFRQALCEVLDGLNAALAQKEEGR